jgi:hypothetical protein
VIRGAEQRDLMRDQQRAAYSARLTTHVMLYGIMLATLLRAC